jgi:hypothetical protein
MRVIFDLFKCFRFGLKKGVGKKGNIVREDSGSTSIVLCSRNHRVSGMREMRRGTSNRDWLRRNLGRNRDGADWDILSSERIPSNWRSTRRGKRSIRWGGARIPSSTGCTRSSRRATKKSGPSAGESVRPSRGKKWALGCNWRNV